MMPSSVYSVFTSLCCSVFPVVFDLLASCFQHGPEECYLNRVEACGLSLMEEAKLDV